MPVGTGDGVLSDPAGQQGLHSNARPHEKTLAPPGTGGAGAWPKRSLGRRVPALGSIRATRPPRSRPPCRPATRVAEPDCTGSRPRGHRQDGLRWISCSDRRVTSGPLPGCELSTARVDATGMNLLASGRRHVRTFLSRPNRGDTAVTSYADSNGQPVGTIAAPVRSASADGTCHTCSAKKNPPCGGCLSVPPRGVEPLFIG